MSQLSAVQIRRFKAIEDAPMDLGPLNVLVGANNSGKSSIIQGLHFGVGILQTVLLSGNWGTKNPISTSINPMLAGCGILQILGGIQHDRYTNRA